MHYGLIRDQSPAQFIFGFSGSFQCQERSAGVSIDVTPQSAPCNTLLIQQLDRTIDLNPIHVAGCSLRIVELYASRLLQAYPEVIGTFCRYS